MSMKIVFILFVICSSFLFSQDSIIPADRTIDWNPGIHGGIPEYPVGVNVKDFGAVGDSLTNDTKAFLDAIVAAQTGTAVLVPEGKYRITETLKIQKSIVLRGEGYQKTKMYYDPLKKSSFIEFQNSHPKTPWIDVLGGYQKGTHDIEVSDITQFHAGDLVVILQNNDPQVFQPGKSGAVYWGDNVTGQMLLISSVEGSVIHTEDPLYYSYNPDMNPRIRKLNQVSRAGLESLYLERIPDNVGDVTIGMLYAVNCWIRSVWSEKTYRNHIAISHSLGNEIRNCYFNHAHNFNGGYAYGVSIAMYSTNNLIENNIFNNLRHSMIVQLGAVGNVFGYNFSTHPRLWNTYYDLMADIVSHGHYAYYNLFEGNIAQYACIDNVWGTNGSTILFRNRIEKRVKDYLSPRTVDTYAYIYIHENNPGQTVVGNEFGYDGCSSNEVVLYDESIESTIVHHGNYDYGKQSIQWDESISEKTLPASLYHNTKPVWFGNQPWPCIGGDIAPNDNIIPAKQRFLNQSYIDNTLMQTIPNAPLQLIIENE